MNKKNVIILLLMPFVIALACLTTINATFNLIDTDIIGISWKYSENEACRVSNTPYQLEAVGQNQKNYPVFNSNLVWSVRNQDSSDTNEYAKIVENNKLLCEKKGNVIVSVTNQKGTIHKEMNVLIYDNSAIVINSLIPTSGSKIDKMQYFGQYDLKNDAKVNAQIPLKVTCYPSSLSSELELSGISDNLEYDKSSSTITIKSSLNDDEKSYVSFSFGGVHDGDEVTYSFKTVKDGINVYSYDDLMYCTNKSENGEVVVLQKNFESEDNLSSISNSVSFGRKENDKWKFNEDVYRFKTKWNTEFIKQWNEYVKENPSYSSISDEILTGIHVQKDFYGNGFSINLHNLTFPYAYSEVNGVKVYSLTDDNLFRGPLSFFTLGDPNGTPLVTAYGQDNIGMYVDGDNITVNDLQLRNCDVGDNLANLEYVGTVLETYGHNITIKNSRIRNGKNVMRAYSSDVLLDNSMLSYSRNFLLSIGSYEYMPINENVAHSFVDDTGSSTTSNIKDYCSPTGVADTEMQNFVTGQVNDNTSRGLYSLQNGLDYTGSDISSLYHGHVEVRDTYFYMSNIASIALESMFNGPYLYASIPSVIGQIFGSLSQGGKSLVPLEAKNCGGISYPVELTLSGKTKFFDYKNSDGMDLSGLILENISKIANSLLGSADITVTMDDIFPIKSLLFREARRKGYLHSSNINVPIAYYGGGLNFSKVIYNRDADIRPHLGDTLSTDMLSELMSLGSTSITSMSGLRSMMKRCVLACIGFNNFKFTLINGDGYLFEETPSVTDLISNAK